MKTIKFFNEQSPTGVVFEYLPNASFFEGLTVAICKLTGLTVDELGLHGHNMYFDTQNGIVRILSKFDMRFVQRQSGGFGGGSIKFKPELNNLHGYFYYGDLEDYIFSTDDDDNEITFDWHADILLAWISDVSMLNKGFKITQKPIEKQKTNTKKTAVSSRVFVHSRLNKDGAYTPFDISEVSAYLDSLS